MTGFFRNANLMERIRLSRSYFSLLAMLGAGILVLALWHSLKAQAPPTPPPYDPATIPMPAQPPAAALGASIFAQNCAPCHGPTGNSDGPTSGSLPAPPPKFADPATVWERSPAEFFHITKYGRIDKLMPPWGNRLSDDQIWQAVYYAWTLHTSQEKVQTGAERYAQSCASCHGATGAGDGPEASGSLPNFSDPAKMSVLTQAELDAGWRQAHAEIGQDWSEDDRSATLDYLRTLSYLPPWESGYRPGNGQLNGTIEQRTPGGGAAGTLPVTLTAYVNFTPAETFTTTADAEGNFRFDQLATGESVAYIASTVYAGVRYNSTVYQLTTTPTQTATLPVYETSNDGSGIHINRANWLIDFEPGGVRVGVILVFSNQSDRTFIGQPQAGVNGAATLALAIPPGATDIQFDDGVLGGRYQQVGDTIYDVGPVVPGEEARQLIYSYLLPVEGDTIQFTQGFLYPVGDLNLLITDLPGLEVEVPDLNFAGNETSGAGKPPACATR